MSAPPALTRVMNVPAILPNVSPIKPVERSFNSAQKQVSDSKSWPGIKSGLPGPLSLQNNFGGMYIIYALVAALVIGIIIIVVDAFYPFLPRNPFGGPSATARAGKTFWKNQNGDAQNLIVKADESPTFRPDTYSMTIQMLIGDSRTPALGKYRHVLHRGSNPCGITSSGSTAVGGSTDPNYTSLGLPNEMNPGLFLDNYKNDLCIFIHTASPTGTMLRESLVVEDLPLNQTINIGLVSNSKTLEVYVNCRLYATHLYSGTPVLSVTNNQWFGRYCSFPFLGSLSNLTLWDAPITSQDMMRTCRSTKILNAPQPCPGGGLTGGGLTGGGLTGGLTGAMTSALGALSGSW